MIRYFVQIFCACLFLCSCTIESNRFDATTGSLASKLSDDFNYIDSLIEPGDNAFDAERTKLAIANLTKALSQPQINRSARTKIHFYRGKAYQATAQNNKATENDSMLLNAEKALKDYNYVIAEGKTKFYSSALYLAGHVAKHGLNNPKLAYDYWLKCAETKHAGCWNIAATAYFQGLYGIKQDFSKVRDWHIKTFNTGTDFLCAGAFSGAFLARMSVFLPKLEYPLGWDQWITKTSELHDELVSDYGVTWECARDTMVIDAFLLRLANNQNSSEQLMATTSKEEVTPSTILARHFLGECNEASVYDIIVDYDEVIQCQTLDQLSIYHTITGNTETAKEVRNRLSKFDSDTCGMFHPWSKIVQDFKNKQSESGLPISDSSRQSSSQASIR